MTFLEVCRNLWRGSWLQKLEKQAYSFWLSCVVLASYQCLVAIVLRDLFESQSRHLQRYLLFKQFRVRFDHHEELLHGAPVMLDSFLKLL
jgi:hypothetical protein